MKYLCTGLALIMFWLSTLTSAHALGGPAYNEIYSTFCTGKSPDSLKVGCAGYSQIRRLFMEKRETALSIGVKGIPAVQ